MNQTTKTISLVLISSALVFVGWGCPLAHEEQQKPHGNNASTTHSHYRTGHSWFWYSSYPHGGYGGAGQVSRPGSGGSSTSHPGGVSSRGGFGSSGASSSGHSGVS